MPNGVSARAGSRVFVFASVTGSDATDVIGRFLMSEKVEVRGDVAQLIGGNVNEAPRQNNVVNFNMGGGASAVERLTDLQRKRISGLVKDLCSKTSEQPLDVYRVILTEFGAARMTEMPRDKYHAIVGTIQRWSAEASEEIGTVKNRTSDQAPGESMPRQADTLCFAYRDKGESSLKLQLLSNTRWLLLGMLIVGFCFLLYRFSNDSEIGSDMNSTCVYEGKPYSLGSVIKSGDGLLHECFFNVSISKTIWIKF